MEFMEEIQGKNQLCNIDLLIRFADYVCTCCVRIYSKLFALVNVHTHSSWATSTPQTAHSVQKRPEVEGVTLLSRLWITGLLFIVYACMCNVYNTHSTPTQLRVCTCVKFKHNYIPHERENNTSTVCVSLYHYGTNRTLSCKRAIRTY